MPASRPVQVNAAEPMLDLEPFYSSYSIPPLPVRFPLLQSQLIQLTGTRSQSLGAAIVLPSPLAVFYVH